MDNPGTYPQPNGTGCDSCTASMRDNELAVDAFLAAPFAGTATLVLTADGTSTTYTLTPEAGSTSFELRLPSPPPSGATLSIAPSQGAAATFDPILILP